MMKALSGKVRLEPINKNEGGSARELSERRLLVVEDEANIVEALSYVLQRAGFVVETVSDGDVALERLKREQFAAVVLDIMIPGMNGFEILRAVRADPRLVDLPIVVLTARGQAKDRQMAEEIGASAFITKPFSNAEGSDRMKAKRRPAAPGRCKVASRCAACS